MAPAPRPSNSAAKEARQRALLRARGATLPRTRPAAYEKRHALTKSPLRYPDTVVIYYLSAVSRTIRFLLTGRMTRFVATTGSRVQSVATLLAALGTRIHTPPGGGFKTLGPSPH